MLAKLFIRAIDQSPQKAIPNFKCNAFRTDVLALFEAQGWVSPSGIST